MMNNEDYSTATQLAISEATARLRLLNDMPIEDQGIERRMNEFNSAVPEIPRLSYVTVDWEFYVIFSLPREEAIKTEVISEALMRLKERAKEEDATILGTPRLGDGGVQGDYKLTAVGVKAPNSQLIRNPQDYVDDLSVGDTLPVVPRGNENDIFIPRQFTQNYSANTVF